VAALLPFKLKRTDMAVARDAAGRDMAAAYFALGKLKDSKSVVNALQAAPYRGRKLVTGFSL
jgi:hypothetical protein